MADTPVPVQRVGGERVGVDRAGGEPVGGDGLPQAPVDEEKRLRRPTSVLQPALRVVAEAGWLTVLYAAAAVFVSHQVPLLGPIEFAGFVLLGALVGWLGRPREELGPALLILAVVAGGALGWLASDDARQMLPNLPAAFQVHLAGWLAGVAVIRGAVINTGERAADDIEKLLRNVPVALAVIWAYAAIAVLPTLWLSFAVSAMWGTVAFLAAAVVSIGMARLNVLHTTVVDPRQRRGWRWLVTAVGFAIVPIAVPIALLSGIPLSQMLSPIGGPLQWLLGLIAIPLSWIVWLLTEIFKPLAGPLGQFLDELQKRIMGRQQVKAEEASTLGTLIGLALWVFTIFVLLLAVFMVARWLLRRKQVQDVDLDPVAADTERAIVVPERPPKAQAPARKRRRGAPHDAVAAYMSALAELEGHLDLARVPNETPAQHAARLRLTNPEVSADFARLAAGYQLARYADRRITPLENIRAVTRFQRIRQLLRASTA